MNTPIGTKFCHLGDKHTNTNGKITIASNLTDTGVAYGLAFCSPKDRFKKSLGRTIAVNRMISGVCENITLNDNETTHNKIMIAILNDIIEYGNDYPNWANDILLNYLDWYNTDNTDNTDMDASNLTDVNDVMEWLNGMPQVDSDLLQIMTAQYFDDLLV